MAYRIVIFEDDEKQVGGVMTPEEALAHDKTAYRELLLEMGDYWSTVFIRNVLKETMTELEALRRKEMQEMVKMLQLFPK